MNKRNFHANYVNGCRNKFIKSCVFPVHRESFPYSLQISTRKPRIRQ